MVLYVFHLQFKRSLTCPTCKQTYFGEVALELAQLNLRIATSNADEPAMATSLNAVGLYLNSQVIHRSFGFGLLCYVTVIDWPLFCDTFTPRSFRTGLSRSTQVSSCTGYATGPPL